MQIFFSYKSLMKNSESVLHDLYALRGSAVVAYTNKAITKEEASEILSTLLVSDEQIQEMLK